MKLAYIIQAHKGFNQLKILVDTLSRNSDVYLHIDKKSQQLYQELRGQYNKSKNIFIITDRVSVNWSGFSQVEATLNLLKATQDKGYDYITLLSGQDLPIKPHSELVRFLEENSKREFLHIANDSENYRWRILRYSPWSDNPKIRSFPLKVINPIYLKVQNLFKVENPYFKDKNIYMGSSWFTLTGEAIKYILDSITPELIENFRKTTCADEHFFQTILMNSQFKDRIESYNLTYIDWSEGNPNPKTLTMEDYPKLLESSKFFARKFDIDVDKEILKKFI
jgi:hypothetical protein